MYRVTFTALFLYEFKNDSDSGSMKRVVSLSCNYDFENGKRGSKRLLGTNCVVGSMSVTLNNSGLPFGKLRVTLGW